MVENCSQTFTTESSVVLALVNGVSGISTKVGNSIILLALYKTPSLQTVSNYFVDSLAGADLFVGLFANSLYVALSGFVSLQEIQELKNAETFVWLFTTTITTLSLCFVAIDRYVAISRPLLYAHILTTNRFFLATMCIWISVRCTILSHQFLSSVQRLAETMDNWLCCDLCTSFRYTRALLLPRLPGGKGTHFEVENKTAHFGWLDSIYR